MISRVFGKGGGARIINVSQANFHHFVVKSGMRRICVRCFFCPYFRRASIHNSHFQRSSIFIDSICLTYCVSKLNYMKHILKHVTKILLSR